MGKYDNNTVEDDSSVGYATPGKLVLYWGSDEDPRCKCGCLETRVGDFRQGHDARLKGKLNRAHTREQPLIILNNGGSEATTPMAYAESRNWAKFLEKAKVTAKRAEDRATVRKSRQSVGRRANPDGGNLDRLELMKACSRVLKALGRYGNDAGDDKIDFKDLSPLEMVALAEGTYEPIRDLIDGDPKSGFFVGQTVEIVRQGRGHRAEVLEAKGTRVRLQQITIGGSPEEWVVEAESVNPVKWG